MDPYASRETLDHSLMYIFAVALEVRRGEGRREGGMVVVVVAVAVIVDLITPSCTSLL